MLEHRWTMRTLISVNVVLCYEPLGLVRGESRDLSLNGMFVDTGRVILQNSQPVIISFSVQGVTANAIQTNGQIVHTSERGAGLEFVGISKKFTQVLEEVLSHYSEDDFYKRLPDQHSIA